MWLLFGFCFTSSLIHTGQMLQCWSSYYDENFKDQNSSLVVCPADSYCAFITSSSGNLSTFWQTCLLDKICNFTTTISVNLGFEYVALSCCDTDGCNTVPEYKNTQNGLKCDSCTNWTDTECNTSLSCVGIEECCFNMSAGRNFTYKGCASKDFHGFSSNSISLNCYNTGKTNLTTNITINIKPTYPPIANTNTTPNTKPTSNTNPTLNNTPLSNTNTTSNTKPTSNTNPTLNKTPLSNTNTTSDTKVTPKPTLHNTGTSWLRDHTVSLLLMTLISVIL